MMDYDYVSTAISRRRPLRPHPTTTSRSYSNTARNSSHPPSSSPSEEHTAAASRSQPQSKQQQQQHQQQQQQQRGSSHRHSLKRTLNLTDLIFYGVGCSVGAGIYSLVGIGANLAGPSIALSFLLCGVACCFTSLAYAEFAARVPLAGSAYTFTYVSFGELCGWLVGWNLTLGYAVSAAVVARSWAEYLVGFLEGLFSSFSSEEEEEKEEGAVMSRLHWLTHAPLRLPSISSLDEEPYHSYECCPLAMVIIGLCTLVLVSGAKESTRFNTAMTILNLSVLGFVLLAGVGSGTVHIDNLTPVFPHGVTGMAHGAGLVFFAFLGFDMVSCLSEEVINPTRNMPIGIIGSLLASLSIYVAISVVVVGMAPVALLGGDVPIINALLANACCTHEEQLSLGSSAIELCLSYSHCDPVVHSVLYVGSRVVSFGAIFGLTTATFACLMGQPRIFYSMAMDGLLFKIYARVHPKTGVPTIGTILTGIVTALIACFIDLESLANAISLGTLQVFTFVNAGVIVLRTRPPDVVPEEEFTTFPSSTSAEVCSPLVRDAEAAVMARSMGLVKKSSHQIREDSIRSRMNRSSVVVIDKVHENGSKPHWFVLVFTISCVVASAGFSHHWHKGVLVIAVAVGMISAGLLFTLPQTPPPVTFTCPMVPFVPLMGILCNSYMMGSMPLATWTIISIWLLVGLIFYFGYGIHHSELRFRKDSSSAAKVAEGDGMGDSELTQRPTDSLLSSMDHRLGGYHSIPNSSSTQF